MENNLPTSDSQSRFDAMASGFKPKLPPKLALMLPFKNQIEGLLAKRASYDDIRLLLEDVNIAVSKNTIYRFCHQVIGKKPAIQRGEKTSKVTPPTDSLPTAKTISSSVESIGAQSPEPRERFAGPWSKKKKGPRIADSKNL